ncbi:MAG: hypothetical protein KJ051_08570 [Thermoleophilia bacterium]|nr:hypothetical protein [Thermoleophilia bacterium]
MDVGVQIAAGVLSALFVAAIALAELEIRRLRRRRARLRGLQPGKPW